MREYGSSLTRILPYKDRIADSAFIGENTGQRKPLFLYILCSVCSTKVLHLIQQSKSVIFDIMIRNDYITYLSFFYSIQIYTYISFEISFQCYIYCPQCLNILKNNIDGEIKCGQIKQCNRCRYRNMYLSFFQIYEHLSWLFSMHLHPVFLLLLCLCFTLQNFELPFSPI